MKRSRMKNVMRCLSFFIIMTSQVFAGDIYYVNSTNGDDNHSGTAPETAWRSINKINNQSFYPGDYILFKRGETWREQLIIRSSGAEGNPITYGAYGSGTSPIINGADIINNWINEGSNIYSKQGITTEPNQVWFDETRGSKKTSIGALISERDWYWESNVLYVYSTSDPDAAYTNPGIEAGARENCITAWNKSYITIENLDLSHANGTYGNGGAAIEFTSNASCFNVIIQDNTIHDNNWDAIWIEATSGNEYTNCIIQRNTIYNSSLNDAASGAIHSIYLHDSTIQNNIIYNNTEHGIRLWNADNNIIQYNTIYSNGSSGITIPGHDGDKSTNNIIRYNECYGNDTVDGGKANIELCYTGGGNKVYYNLMYDGVTQGLRTWDADGDFIYNNVIYNSATEGIKLSNSQSLTIKNNIIMTSGNEHIQVNADSTIGNDIESNLYGDDGYNKFNWGGTNYNFESWKINSGQDINSPSPANPLFDDASNNNFILQPISPAIDTGASVGLTEDYAGNTVPNGWAVDIGAYEYQGSVDPLTANINASPTSGYVPLTVSFTVGASGGTSPYSYSWSFGDGGSSSEQNPSHTYSDTGTYTVTLNVTDSNSNQASDSLTVTASAPTPPLSASASASPTSGYVPLTVNFTANASGGTPSYSYSWDFGDGSSSSSKDQSHTYSQAGTYSVTLTITDSNSNQASDSLTITASANPPYNLTISSATGSPAPGEGGATDPSSGNYSYSSGSAVKVKATPNDNYRFSKWTRDVNDSERYNEEITITMDKDRSISAHFYTKCGDVNGDLNITPADAQAAFDIFLGRISNPTDSEKENADVNGDGTKTEPNITPADAQAIFEKFLGKNELPSDCSGNARTGSVSAQRMHAPNINLIINDIQVNLGEEIIVPIIVDNPFNIEAFGFDLLFPTEILEFVGVEKTELSKDFVQVDANKIAEGVVRIGGYGSMPIRDHFTDELIRLIFKPIRKPRNEIFFLITNTVDDLENAVFQNGEHSGKRKFKLRE